MLTGGLLARADSAWIRIFHIDRRKHLCDHIAGRYRRCIDPLKRPLLLRQNIVQRFLRSTDSFCASTEKTLVKFDDGWVRWYDDKYQMTFPIFENTRE